MAFRTSPDDRIVNVSSRFPNTQPVTRRRTDRAPVVGALRTETAPAVAPPVTPAWTITARRPTTGDDARAGTRFADAAIHRPR